MRELHQDLVGLAQLHRVESAGEVRALWRRSLASLAALAIDEEPVPLEGLNPDALLHSVRVALTHNLVDDLDWLAPPAAAVALFELASALPKSGEQRLLGRRVLTSMLAGDVDTFVAVATALALGSRRGLRGEGIRPRVALALRLPFDASSRADALALALVSRRDLAYEWLSLPSTGSLPSRRLAARLIERAAREAARRAAHGDDSGVRALGTPAVETAWARMLADRESLVWRHAAAARGLLFDAMPHLAEQVQREHAPELTPTEWRRAAASVAASVSIDPERGLAGCRAMLDALLARDSGVAGAMGFGAPAAAEAEPDAAEELLSLSVEHGGLFAIEALVDARRERMGGTLGAGATERALAWIAAATGRGDDGTAALLACLRSDLTADATDRLGDRLVSALAAFAHHGATGAATDAGRALAAAQASMTDLESASEADAGGRRRAFTALRELDRGLLETSTLADLLEVSESGASLAGVFERLTRWLLSREAEPMTSGDVPHVTWRLRRLRTLLHLVDSDAGGEVEQPARARRRRLDTASDVSATEADAAERRARRMDTACALFVRMAGDPPSPLRRTLCAALARSIDAVVREELCELSDVVLAAGACAQSPDDVAVLGEAVMELPVKSALGALAAAAAAAAGGASPAECVAALRGLARELPPASSTRVEALRRALDRFAHALADVLGARGLSELPGDAMTGVLARLESGAQSLAQLTAGARRRFELPVSDEPPRCGPAVRAVDAQVDRVIGGGDRAALGAAIADATGAVIEELPSVLAAIAARVIARVADLPVTAPPRADRDDGAVEPERGADEGARMAPWIPPNRTLGGFYIVRTIGRGAGGSVFVACRSEERHASAPQCFALKVPEYSGSASHTLSEAEFNRLFREEAGALLALPEHPNLAGFVTFDVGARPKPILVMELVEGPTLERVLDKRELDVPRALAVLDGIAAGLAAMHACGVAHLDVKMSNVILRPADGGERAVLVDFGLAGRQVRPGCATVHFGAPEVWATEPLPVGLPPMPTDVYAFCCLAHELFTGDPLVDGDTAVAVITAHLTHDGYPPLLAAMHRNARLRPLAELLARGLRKEPAHRASIAQLRAGLAELAPSLSDLPWPVAVR